MSMMDDGFSRPVESGTYLQGFVAGLGWGLFFGAAGWMVYFAWYLGGI